MICVRTYSERLQFMDLILRKSQFLPMIIRQIQNKNLSKNSFKKKPQIMRDFLHLDDLVKLFSFV